MNAPAATTRAAWTGVRGVIAIGTCLVGLTLVLGLALWPPTWSPTLVALVVLYAAATSHPVMVRHSTRAEFILVNEAVAAVAVLALPPQDVLWVVLLGALATPIAVRFVSPLERMRRAPVSRHLFNVSANSLCLLPMVALAAMMAPLGAAGLGLAALAGLLVHGALSHTLVTWVIALSTRTHVPHADRLWSPASLSLAMAAVALPVGLVVRASDPDWPLLLTLAMTLVTLSRTRMDHDQASHWLAAIGDAAKGFVGADTIAEVDARLTATLRDVLQCAVVEVVVRDGAAPNDTDPAAPLDDATWVVAREPAMGRRWTRVDQELVDAIAAVAAPQRDRLHVLHQTVESERFASLVLTAAGHDITNQLHAATMAIGTSTRWSDRLDEDDQRRLADQAVRAIHRASSSLRDLVAIGASGPGASTPAAEVALFVRGLGPDLHVVCDNVRIAAPAAVVERALENLVRNAQRHHVGDEPLQVVIADDGETARIDVCDRGPGLASGHVETLFAPFAQLADDRGRHGSLGLGLFIARGLAESVGGSLGYRHRDDGGAVFTLRIPSVPKDPSERVQERIVLGPRPDRDAQAPLEPRLGREVTDEDALRE